MSDAAVAAIVTGFVTVVTMITGFFTLWIKLKYGVAQTEALANRQGVVESKLDHNTQLTREGTDAAVANAREAVKSASEAKAATEGIDRKLNGGIDSAIEIALAPLRAKIDGIEQYVHQRNHDLLNALQIQSSKISAIMLKLEEMTG